MGNGVGWNRPHSWGMGSAGTNQQRWDSFIVLMEPLLSSVPTIHVAVSTHRDRYTSCGYTPCHGRYPHHPYRGRYPPRLNSTQSDSVCVCVVCRDAHSTHRNSVPHTQTQWCVCKVFTPVGVGCSRPHQGTKEGHPTPLHAPIWLHTLPPALPPARLHPLPPSLQPTPLRASNQATFLPAFWLHIIPPVSIR